jgi:hypothetical protein
MQMCIRYAAGYQFTIVIQILASRSANVNRCVEIPPAIAGVVLIDRCTRQKL